MSLFLTGILTFTLIINYIGNISCLKTAEEKYTTLSAKAIYSEDILHDEELMRDILDYNKVIQTNLKYHNDPWFGFLEPLDLSEIKLIDISEYFLFYHLCSNCSKTIV